MGDTAAPDLTRSARRRVLSYGATTAVLAVLTVASQPGVAAWQGSVHLHTLMEALATLLALLVGLMGLVQYAALPLHSCGQR